MYIYIDMVGSGLSNIEWYRGVRYTGFECVHRRATKQHGSCNRVMWSAGIDDLKFERSLSSKGFPPNLRSSLLYAGYRLIE